jgi:hypothetical protein
MDGRRFQRSLGFERLENKLLPGALLLLLAPLEEDAHAAAERAGWLDAESGPSTGMRGVAAQWRHHRSIDDLLRYIEENTNAAGAERSAMGLPTVEQCAAADEMMKLGDGEMRAMVLADLFAAAGGEKGRS